MIKEWDLECFELFLICEIEKSNHLKACSKTKNFWKKFSQSIRNSWELSLALPTFHFYLFSRIDQHYADSRTRIKGNARRNNSQEF